MFPIAAADPVRTRALGHGPAATKGTPCFGWLGSNTPPCCSSTPFYLAYVAVLSCNNSSSAHKMILRLKGFKNEKHYLKTKGCVWLNF